MVDYKATFIVRLFLNNKVKGLVCIGGSGDVIVAVVKNVTALTAVGILIIRDKILKAYGNV